MLIARAHTLRAIGLKELDLALLLMSHVTLSMTLIPPSPVSAFITWGSDGDDFLVAVWVKGDGICKLLSMSFDPQGMCNPQWTLFIHFFSWALADLSLCSVC